MSEYLHLYNELNPLKLLTQSPFAITNNFVVDN